VHPPMVPPHQYMSWRRVAELGVVGLASDVRDRRTGRLPVPAGPARPLWQRLDPRVTKPIFVVGAPRTGTTFLGQCIGQLADVSYHFEPRLTKAVARCVYEQEWSPRKASRVFRTSYSALLLAGGDGSKRFAEKNPENCFILSFLMETFPDAQFVLILRDGRDAAVSHAEKPWLAARSANSGKRGRGGTAWGPEPRFWVEADRHDEFRATSDIERSAWCWRRFTAAAVENSSHLPADRVLTVRYETMVHAPLDAAHSLADYLGVPAGLPRQPLLTALAAAHPSSVGRWQGALSAEDVAAVTRQCGPLLTQLGYVQ